jgi:hypothetical protein
MVFSFSAAGLAQTQNVTSKGQKAPMVEKKTAPAEKATFTGKVVAVDPVDKTIVVKAKEGAKMFDVSDVPQTFRSGQVVHVAYRIESGKMVVLSVRSGMRTTMAGPAYGYDPYYGFDPHFYGYDQYASNDVSHTGG